jgi:outer membrane protein TolC
LLDLSIGKAELEATNTDIWHRLLPDIRLSANVGVQQLVFIDPTTSIPYIVPKDSYRLTATLSLSALFDGAKHESAGLTVLLLQTRKELAIVEQEVKRNAQLHEMQSLDHRLSTLNEELTLVQKILDFKQLLFDQGKIDFDELCSARIALLHVKQNIAEFEIKYSSLQRGLE